MTACEQCDRLRKRNEEWRRAYSIVWRELDTVRRAMNLLDSQVSDLKRQLDVSSRERDMAKARLLAAKPYEPTAEETKDPYGHHE